MVVILSNVFWIIKYTGFSFLLEVEKGNNHKYYARGKEDGKQVNYKTC